MERDSRQAMSDALGSPFPELTDAEYAGFVRLWGDRETADDQLNARYGLLGHRSALELLGDRGNFFLRLPLVRERRRRRLLLEIQQAHAMNRAGVYA
jgi:hypothetical protein